MVYFSFNITSIDPAVKKYADFVGRDAQVYLEGLNEFSNFRSKYNSL